MKDMKYAIFLGGAGVPESAVQIFKEFREVVEKDKFHPNSLAYQDAQLGALLRMGAEICKVDESIHKKADEVMQQLLEDLDWQIRVFDHDHDYDCGYTDAMMQCVLNIGKILGENDHSSKPYKFEAYKRVMEYTTTKKYIKKYPKPISPLQEVNDGK